MKTKITLPDGQVYRLGDVYRQPLKPEQFNRNDRIAAQAICDAHNADGDAREIAVIRNITDDELTLSTGTDMARFMVHPALPEPEPEPTKQPEPEPTTEPKKRRGRPRKKRE